MEYSELQKHEFKSQFVARRRRQLIIAAPLVLIVILLVTANEEAGLVLGSIPILVFAPVALVAIIAGIIFSLINWRCPACNKYLGKTINPAFCSKCGTALR